MLFLFFFFFKQKTAYEMRISDWSSDVCSSDLHVVPQDRAVARKEARHRHAVETARRRHAPRRAQRKPQRFEPGRRARRRKDDHRHRPRACADRGVLHQRVDRPVELERVGIDQPPVAPRSEEHTSELQSLMRTSYAVFCLKKKTKTKQ